MTINSHTQQHILELLKGLKLREICDTYFDEKFSWTIKGTSVLSGNYNDKEDFFNRVMKRLNNVLQSGWKMHILDTYITENVFIIEMKGEVKAKNGADYNNEYVWIFKLNEQGKITNCTAYYDSLLVNRTLAENE